MDGADVLRGAFLDAADQRDDSPREPGVWPLSRPRRVAGNRSPAIGRRRPGTRGRGECGEIALDPEAVPAVIAAALASRLLRRSASSTREAARAERLPRPRDAVDPIDREVLALRHFERPSRVETAQLLGISVEAGDGRSIRALVRLEETLVTIDRRAGEHLACS
jgi:RNA polymerase sigma-70 factor (ECF subfamily)